MAEESPAEPKKPEFDPEKLAGWVKEHGSEDERRRTKAENDLWTKYLESEGVTELRETLKRAEAMGLKDEAAKAKEQYEAALKKAGETFEERKKALFEGLESALKELGSHPVWEDMSHEDVEAYVHKMNEAEFEYIAAVQNKPVLEVADLMDRDEMVRFIVMEKQSDDLWVILTEGGKVTYLEGERTNEAQPARSS